MHASKLWPHAVRVLWAGGGGAGCKRRQEGRHMNRWSVREGRHMDRWPVREGMHMDRWSVRQGRHIDRWSVREGRHMDRWSVREGRHMDRWSVRVGPTKDRCRHGGRRYCRPARDCRYSQPTRDAAIFHGAGRGVGLCALCVL